MAERPGLDLRQPAHVFVVVVLIILGAHFLLTNVKYLFLSDFVDFDIYYTAALVFRERGDPYERGPFFMQENRNPHFFEAGMRAGTVHSHRGFRHVHPYYYPPLLGFLFIPLTFVSKSVAGTLWLALNVTLVLFALALLVRMTALRSPTAIALAVVLTLSFHAVDETLALGQVNMVVAFLVFAAVHLFCVNRRDASAFVLALSIAIKVQSAPILFYFLLSREFRYVAVCAMSLVFVHLPVLALLGPGPFLVWAGEVTPMMASGFASSVNQALSGWVLRMLASLGLRDAAGAGPWIHPVAAVAFLVASVRWLRLRRGDHLYNLSVFSVIVLVIAPFTWNAHLVLLLLPITYLLRALETRAPVRGRFEVAFVLAYVLLGVVATEFYTNRRLTGVLSVFASVRLYGMLLLLYCLHAVRGGEAEASRPGP